MNSQYPPVTLPDTEVRSLFSTTINQEFSLFIALPENYHATDESYPVLFILDGNGSFGIVTEVVRYLLLYQEIPEIVVVGIGYPVKGFLGARGLRVRDLTPTEDNQWLEGYLKFRPGEHRAGGTGGAKQFLQFIREELQPFIQSNYRIDPNDAAIQGYSFGGLFALYTLLKAPETFKRYIIGSPSIWWDPEEIFMLEANYAQENSDLSAIVFLSAGTLEESLPVPVRGGPCAFVSNVQAMADRLESRGYPALRLRLHIFEGETHLSGIPGAISTGLREVYGADS